jgi:hypothetical protein
MRYAVIMQNASQDDPQTKIVFTGSLRQARAMAEQAVGYAYDPQASQNWHRRLASVYELPTGWRRPSWRQLSRMVGDRWRSAQDVLAHLIRQAGTRVA